MVPQASIELGQFGNATLSGALHFLVDRRQDGSASANARQGVGIPSVSPAARSHFAVLGQDHRHRRRIVSEDLDARYGQAWEELEGGLKIIAVILESSLIEKIISPT